MLCSWMHHSLYPPYLCQLCCSQGPDNRVQRSVHAVQTHRAFYKHLRKVVEAADVIVEVLDARDPLVRPRCVCHRQPRCQQLTVVRVFIGLPCTGN